VQLAKNLKLYFLINIINNINNINKVNNRIKRKGEGNRVKKDNRD
jgi:hypothetical protein